MSEASSHQDTFSTNTPYPWTKPPSNCGVYFTEKNVRFLEDIPTRYQYQWCQEGHLHSMSQWFNWWIVKWYKSLEETPTLTWERDAGAEVALQVTGRTPKVCSSTTKRRISGSLHIIILPPSTPLASLRIRTLSRFRPVPRIIIINSESPYEEKRISQCICYPWVIIESTSFSFTDQPYELHVLFLGHWLDEEW